MSEQQKKRRHTPDPFTSLFFCTRCGVEVYRRAHVRIRTKKIVMLIGQESRMALVQHAQRAQHSASLTGELRVNERFGDDGFEVNASEEKAPQHTQASSVLRILGLLPS